MKKKVVSTVLASALTASMVAGSVSTAFAEEAKAPEVSHDEELTLEVYDQAANYQGLQTGWFGKVLKLSHRRYPVMAKRCIRPEQQRENWAILLFWTTRICLNAWMSD